MKNAILIRPSKDLRSNYSQISLLTRKNPVTITVNGKEDTVVFSHEAYMGQMNYISELESKLAMYMHLAQGEDDIRLGRVQEFNDVFDDILDELDTIEL